MTTKPRPCQAKDPATCRWHGTPDYELALQGALERQDMDTYHKILKLRDEIEESNQRRLSVAKLDTPIKTVIIFDTAFPDETFGAFTKTSGTSFTHAVVQSTPYKVYGKYDMTNVTILLQTQESAKAVSIGLMPSNEASPELSFAGNPTSQIHIGDPQELVTESARFCVQLGDLWEEVTTGADGVYGDIIPVSRLTSGGKRVRDTLLISFDIDSTFIHNPDTFLQHLVPTS